MIKLMKEWMRTVFCVSDDESTDIVMNKCPHKMNRPVM